MWRVGPAGGSIVRPKFLHLKCMGPISHSLAVNTWRHACVFRSGQGSTGEASDGGGRVGVGDCQVGLGKLAKMARNGLYTLYAILNVWMCILGHYSLRTQRHQIVLAFRKIGGTHSKTECTFYIIVGLSSITYRYAVGYTALNKCRPCHSSATIFIGYSQWRPNDGQLISAVKFDDISAMTNNRLVITARSGFELWSPVFCLHRSSSTFIIGYWDHVIRLS